MDGNKVVLVGLPGSGKTTLGGLLHESGYSWVDLDSIIESESNRSITEIVRVEGEQSFREIESTMLKKVLSGDTQVISIGGGCLGKLENKELIKKTSLVVCLKSNSDELARRVLEEEQGSPKRPVIFSEPSGNMLGLNQVTAKINELAVKREQDFEIASITLRTDFSSPDYLKEVLAVLIRKALSKEMKLTAIPFKTKKSSVSDAVEISSKSSTIICGLKNFFQILDLSKTKTAVVIDKNVNKLLNEYISSSLNLKNSLVIEVESGEKVKSIQNLEEILNRLIENGFSRKDYIIAIGGGVVGDLAGLVASIYMRGVNLIQVPTTLVGQVDSAIGGKTAINLQSGKNAVGTTYPAKYVLCDTALLKTLPEREYISGLAEVVKYALTYSSEFFNWIETNLNQIKNRDEKAIAKIVEFCVLQKTAVVVKDLCDVSGIRAILNFGHTIGHAVEKLTEYKKFLHGEAISIGMVEALFISNLTLGLKQSEIKRIVLLLKNLGLPVKMPQDLLLGGTEAVVNKEAEAVIKVKKDFLKDLKLEDIQASSFKMRWEEAIKADKKRESDKIKYIALRRLGEAEVKELDVGLIIGCIAWNKEDLLEVV